MLGGTWLRRAAPWEGPPFPVNHACHGARGLGERGLLSSCRIHSRRFCFSKHATKSTRCCSWLSMDSHLPSPQGPWWLQNAEHPMAEAAPPCALLLQLHRLPWEWMEPSSLNVACKERPHGCPSPIRVPSPASQQGCTDFLLLQAGMAGKTQGNCMRGYYPTTGGDSFQGHKTISFGNT